MDKNTAGAPGPSVISPGRGEVEIHFLEDDGTPSTAHILPVLNDDGKLEDPLPPGAARQDDGTVRYTLQYPCVVKYRRPSGDIREESVTELHLHRLTGADMRAVQAAKSDAGIVVAIARSSRINEAKMNLIFDRMDGADAAAVGGIVSDFLGTGRKTGR